MEFIEGNSFREYSRHHELQENIQIIRSIADALSYAHQKGIVHRDIKPSNILVDKDGKAYLTDFGLARSIRVEDRRLTRTGQVLGTPNYMSPEQAKGRRKNLDGSTDTYALGVILYEIATGQEAFSGKNPMEILYKVVASSPLAPHYIQPEIDRNLEAIILKAMAYKKDDRYLDANLFAKDLQNYLQGNPVSVEVQNRGLMWLKSNNALIGKILLASTVLIVCLFGCLYLLNSSPRVNRKILREKIELFFKEKKYTKAKIHLEKYLRSFPFDKRGIYLKALILERDFFSEKKDRQREILESMRQAWQGLYKLSKTSKDLEYIQYIAKAAFSYGEFKLAKKYSERVLQFSPNSSDIRENIIYILLQEKKYHQAQKRCKKNSTLFALCEAILIYHEGKVQEAYEKLEKCQNIHAFPDFLRAEIYWWEGVFFWEMNSSSLNYWNLLKNNLPKKSIQFQKLSMVKDFFRRSSRCIQNSKKYFLASRTRRINVYKCLIDLELARYPLDEEKKNIREEIGKKLGKWDDSPSLELLLKQAYIRSFIRSKKNWKRGSRSF